MSPSPLRSKRSATAPISIRDVSNSGEENCSDDELTNFSKKILTRSDDSIDEDFARYQAIVVFVHLAEQIREARLFVVHELQELREKKNDYEVVRSKLSKM
jgi:hypothetical protein